MKILVSGLYGFMGREVVKLAENGYCDAEVVAGVDNNITGKLDIPCAESFAAADKDVDCIVDFSHHSLTNDLLAFAVTNKIPAVIATTGQTDEEKEAIRKASESIPIFFAANYSLGIALLIKLAKEAAAVMKDAEIEIIEKHHDRKVDAPSGTALAIAEGIRSVRPELTNKLGRAGMGKRTPNEIGIHAIRMGNIAGEHEVLIGTQNQTITLKHETHNRALFAEGALNAAQFLIGQKNGLYSMTDLLK